MKILALFLLYPKTTRLASGFRLQQGGSRFTRLPPMINFSLFALFLTVTQNLGLPRTVLKTNKVITTG